MKYFYSCALLFCVFTLHAQVPELFVDLNTKGKPINAEEFIEFQGQLYFAYDNGLQGTQLYKTTDSDVLEMVKLLNVCGDAEPANFRVVNDRLYFIAMVSEDCNSEAKAMLIRSDGSRAGTQALAEVSGDHFWDIYAHAGEVILHMEEFDKFKHTLLATDGTIAGTYVFAEFDGWLQSPSVSAGNHIAYLQKENLSNFSSIYETLIIDGPMAEPRYIGEVKLVNNNFMTDHHMVAMNGEIFFAGRLRDVDTGMELLKINASMDSVLLVKDMSPGTQKSFYSNHFTLSVMNDLLYFRIGQVSLGTSALWRSDGTEAGTYLVKDIAPAEDNSWGNVEALHVADDYLYFVAENCTDNKEMYRSDGTDSGTILLKDINPSGNCIDQNGSTIISSIAIGKGNKAYFLAQLPNSTHRQVYQTDGTPSGTTTLLTDTTGFSMPDTLLIAGTSAEPKVFVRGTVDSFDEPHLVRTDGTEGFVALKSKENQSSFPGEMHIMADQLFFTSLYQGLYYTDGDANNITPLYDQKSDHHALLNEQLVFSSDEGFFAVNTDLSGVKRLSETKVSSPPLDVENNAFFTTGALGSTGNTILHGRVGEYLDFQLNSGVSGHGLHPTWLTYTGNKEVYFAAEFTVSGRELAKMSWTGDLAQDDRYELDYIFLVPGAAGSDPSHLTIFDEACFFIATDANDRQQLYRTDGSDAGTFSFASVLPASMSNVSALTVKDHESRLKPLPVFNGYLYFTVHVGGSTSERKGQLWRTNGTLEGTELVQEFPSLDEFALGDHAIVGDALFFVANSLQGTELFITRGGLGEVQMVKDIFPGTKGSAPQRLFPVHGNLYFSANDGVHGYELWRSDGTTEGTELVIDLFPGVVESGPIPQALYKDHFYFSALDDIYGREIWRIACPGKYLKPLPDQTVCLGNEITLDAGSFASNYSWSNGATTPQITLTPTVSQTLTVTATEGGCSSSASFELMVTNDPLPQVDLGEDLSSCGGLEEITIGIPDEGHTYEWTPNIGNQSSHTIKPSTTTNYQLKVITDKGCFAADEKNIEILESPLITSTDLIFACPGEPFWIDVDGADIYEWSNGAVTTDTLFVEVQSDTTLSVVGTIANGCQDEESFDIKIRPELGIEIINEDIPCDGSPINLSGNITCDAPTYFIKLDDIDFYGWDGAYVELRVNGQVRESLTLGFQELDLGHSLFLETGDTLELVYFAGAYEDGNYIYLYDTKGNLIFNNSVAPEPGVIFRQQVNCDAAHNVLLECSDFTLNMKDFALDGWNGAYIDVFIDDILRGAYTVDEEEATYHFPLNSRQKIRFEYISGSFDAENSFEILKDGVEVYASGPSPSAGLAHSDQADCRSAILEGYLQEDVSWWSTTSISDPTAWDITANPLTGDQFAIQYTSDWNCVLTDTFTVELSGGPAVSILGETNICQGESTTLTVETNAAFVWTHNSSSSNTQTVQPDQTTTYIVETTNDEGCVFQTAVTVTVNEAPMLAINGDLSICVGEETTLVATGAATYLWNSGETTSELLVNPLATSTYTLVGTNALGCTSQAIVEVVVNELPTVLIEEPGLICMGAPITLSASGAQSYVWSTGQTGSSISLEATSQEISVVGTDGNGCSGEDLILLAPLALPIINISGDSIVCPGTPATLTAEGANQLVWNTGANSATIEVVPEQSSTYSVIGTSDDGCEGAASFTVQTYDMPLQPVLIFDGEVISVSNVQGNLEWYLNGTLIASNQSSWTPQSGGEYQVIYTDDNGCKSASELLNVTINSTDNLLLGQLKIYPNPSTKTLHIELPAELLLHSEEVAVYNLLGQQLLSKVPALKMQVEVADWPAGTYLVKVKSHSGIGLLKKFVVQK